MNIAVTGHRPDKLGGYEPCSAHLRLYDLIHRGFQIHKPEMVFLGMALGTDQIAARACVALGLPFTAVVPFNGQELHWPVGARHEYERLLGYAAKIEVCCSEFNLEAFQVRNERLVQKLRHWQGDFLLAVWDRSPSGTGKTISYARQRGERIRYIDPRPLLNY